MSWGEIYNTSWWGVALDTARTVKARPDFFGSQLNLLTSEQPNLVTNGTFDTDSDWTLGTGWSISGGKAICDGTQSTTSGLIQNNVFENNKKYKLTFDLTSNGQELKIWVNGSQYINSFYSSNTYTLYINTNTSGNVYFEATVNFIGSITNISVQLVRAELDQIEAKKCLADWIHTTALKDLNN